MRPSQKVGRKYLTEWRGDETVTSTGKGLFVENEIRNRVAHEDPSRSDSIYIFSFALRFMLFIFYLV